MRRASTRLLAVLEQRRAQGEASGEAAALDHEIEALRSSLATWLDEPDAPPKDATQPASVGSSVGARLRTTGIALGLGLALGFGLARLAGNGPVTREPVPGTGSVEAPGTLLLTGGVSGATLRVLDADRNEILLERPALDARVELPGGRYAIEVSREDCPDRWTRSVYFEPGSVHRFAPELCLGEGRLVVRSNVAEDRLRIDGLDVGATGAREHRLGVGDHEVRVEKQGFRPFEGRVRVRPDEQVELRADLVPLGGPSPVASERPTPVARSAPPVPPPPTRPLPYDLEGLKEAVAPESALALPNDLLDGGRLRDDGGSTRWHEQRTRELLARFDLDRSGHIDRLEESEAIPCSIWRSLEADFDRGGLGLPMARYYGFDGSEWHPGALGFDRSQRSAAFAKMKECGLRGRIPAEGRTG